MRLKLFSTFNESTTIKDVNIDFKDYFYDILDSGYTISSDVTYVKLNDEKTRI